MTTTMSPYQHFIHQTRYARWLETEKRRETWEETVDRYINFFKQERANTPELQTLLDEAKQYILSMKVMPSMRALMTAGEALKRENIAGFNCSYIAINNKRAFAEALYILMCFHPDTLVVTRKGNKRIADIQVNDEVLSIDEISSEAVWKHVTNVIQTKSSNRPKVAVTLENGNSIKCTADHKWLTTNRGWVEAKDLNPNDALAAPTHQIYRITNLMNGKAYIGQTSKSVEVRFKEHVYVATTQPSEWHFAKALRKYDTSCWGIEIIDFAFSAKEANEKEIKWIADLDTIEQGYNSTVGGEGALGYVWTEEQRTYASENAYERTENHRENLRKNIQKAHEKINITRQTPEYKEAQRIRNSGAKNPQFGKKLPVERIEQIRNQTKGTSNPFYGHKHTEESKAKIRATKLVNKQLKEQAQCA